MEASHPMPAFLTAKKYREQHAGYQQKGKNQYNEVFFFHPAILSKIRYKKPTRESFDNFNFLTT